MGGSQLGFLRSWADCLFLIYLLWLVYFPLSTVLGKYFLKDGWYTEEKEHVVREMTRKKAEHLKPHDFKPIGDKPLRQVPVSVKLPPELDDYVRSQSNRNQWLIAAVAEKIERERNSPLVG